MLVIQVDVPYLSVNEYARRTGETPRGVKAMCERGKLPVKPRVEGEKYMVNNALLVKQALEQEI